jgi:hypothetical protein
MEGIFVRIPGELEPFETPFDKPGRPTARSQFIYLSNRGPGRYSGLLPMDFDWKRLSWSLADYFPQGYTNLLHIEKVYTSLPDPSERTSYKKDNRWSPRVYIPKGYSTDWKPLAGKEKPNLFLVLREPISEKHPHDIIGKMFAVQRAINMAERYSKTYGKRAVVGQLLADQTWH